MTLEERLAAPMRAKPEMCSLNMGSMNFGHPSRRAQTINDVAASTGKSRTSKASRDHIFRNTYKDIKYILKKLGEGHGTRFEFECYDVGPSLQPRPFR